MVEAGLAGEMRTKVATEIREGRCWEKLDIFSGQGGDGEGVCNMFAGIPGLRPQGHITNW